MYFKYCTCFTRKQSLRRMTRDTRDKSASDSHNQGKQQATSNKQRCTHVAKIRNQVATFDSPKNVKPRAYQDLEIQDLAQVIATEKHVLLLLLL